LRCTGAAASAGVWLTESPTLLICSTRECFPTPPGPPDPEAAELEPS